MTPLFLPMPDVEASAARLLREAQFNAVPVRAYSSLPNTPTYPLCVVQRFGGRRSEKHKLDAPRIQIDVWGTSKSEARDLAELAERTLLEAGETHRFVSEDECQITSVEEELGPTFQPDPVSKRDRYVLTVRIYAHNRTV